MHNNGIHRKYCTGWIEQNEMKIFHRNFDCIFTWKQKNHFLFLLLGWRCRNSTGYWGWKTTTIWLDYNSIVSWQYFAICSGWEENLYHKAQSSSSPINFDERLREKRDFYLTGENSHLLTISTVMRLNIFHVVIHSSFRYFF